jgi:hypothetical protein
MQAPSTKIDWLTIGQLIVGGISCLISFSLVILLVYLGVSGGLSKANSAMDTTAMFMLAGSITAIGILNIPSVVLAVRSLSGKQDEPAIKTNSFRMASLGLISLPVWLLVGQSITQTILAAWLLPWINILALVIPIWWLVEFGRRQLPSGSPQRSWGLISVSLGVTPLITILAELIVTIIVLLAVFTALSSDPLWMDKFNQLIIQFNQSGQDPQFFESFFKDLLASPLVISAIFLTVGLLMPLMEELLKPLGLWALRKRLLTPAEGFSGGLICGAGFALIESATMIAQNGGGSDWGQMVLLRIGTSLLHMVCWLGFGQRMDSEKVQTHLIRLFGSNRGSWTMEFAGNPCCTATGHHQFKSTSCSPANLFRSWSIRHGRDLGTLGSSISFNEPPAVPGNTINAT